MRTSRPPDEGSQSTTSYPIGGSVRSNSSFSSTTAGIVSMKSKKQKKMGCRAHFSYLSDAILPEIGGYLKGLRALAPDARRPQGPLGGRSAWLEPGWRW